VIDNLMFAADYVRTTTDLATMEGANEAGRLAANAIFTREGRAPDAALFPLVEDAGPLVALARRLDRRRWEEEKDLPSFAAGTITRAGEEPTLESARAREAALVEKLKRLEAAGTV
jgi:hypothetical protein